MALSMPRAASCPPVFFSTAADDFPVSSFFHHPSPFLPAQSPPPSCHPALLAEDEIADAHRTSAYQQFHARLCERLELVLLRQQRQRQLDLARIRAGFASHDSQNELRNTGATLAISEIPPRRSLKRRRSSQSTSLGQTPASDEQLMHPRKRMASFKPYITSSASANAFCAPNDGDDPFSWWRPLTPSPSITPETAGKEG